MQSSFILKSIRHKEGIEKESLIFRQNPLYFIQVKELLIKRG